MNIHEGRLRAMVDPDTGRGWDLNDEDRAAIQWTLDAILSLKNERDEIRQEYSTSAHRDYERRKRIATAAEELTRALG